MNDLALTGGRWETVRGIQRWVPDGQEIGAIEPVVHTGRCIECDVEIAKAYCRGKCRRCYDKPRRKTDIRRRPSAETVAEWRELAAHGMSVREGAATLGISLSGLYAAIKRVNRAECERWAA